MADEYHLISNGIQLGADDPQAVRERLAKYIKSPELIEKLCGDRRMLIKRAGQRESLERYATLLRQCGLSVEILAATRKKPAPTRVKKTPPPAPPEPVAKLLPETPAAEAPAAPREPSPAPAPPAPTSRRARFKYAFDTFMSGGSSAMFKALVIVFLASFLLLGIVRAVFLIFLPDVTLQNETGFWGGLYTTFLQLTDPGNMAQDIFSSAWYKVFAVIAGLVGVVLFSALIAFITSALEQKLRDLRQGRSKVIEADHTLILGWNDERITEILRELIMANESEDDACVVILADEDKEHMDQIIRLRIPDGSTTRIVTRSGKITLQANLEKVAIERAKSVIILAECKDTDTWDAKVASDARVIQTILAATGKMAGQTVVAELFNTTYREIVESTLSENVVIVNTSEILAKLLVQTSRSVGLSVVYSEILSFDGCEIYFYHADWPDTPFGELVFHFDDGVPLGYKDSAGSIHLNPDREHRLQAGDEIIIVADDDSTVALQPSPVAGGKARPLPERVLSQKTENQLLIGWNQKSPIVIQEFAEYVVDGEIDVLLKNPDDTVRATIDSLDQSLDNLSVRLVEKDHLNRDHLLALSPFRYDNIIIFSSQGEQIDAQQVDSENIVCLLLLRHIFQEQQGEVQTKLITEVMDSQNHALVSRAGVKDVIISSRLLSMIMAQISENQDIKRVYDDIFDEDGSEIYLKPANLYFETLPEEVTFGDMIRQAQQRSEICLGLKIKADETDADNNFGVQLIPPKTKAYRLVEEDCLVVLAENEL